jgi:hypothetical protein
MALIKVSDRPLDYEYIALSTDIANNKIAGASVVGARVYLVDTAAFKIVKSDLTLGDYTGYSSGSGAVVLGAGEAHIGEVAGKTSVVSVEITLTSSGATYGQNDSVVQASGSMIEFANLARVNGGSGYITGISLITDKKSITPAWRLHFFNASDATVPADNAIFYEVYESNKTKKLGYYDLPAMTTAADATNSTMSRTLDMTTVRFPFKCAAATRSIWVALETLTSFIPANSQKFYLTLYAELN